MGPFLRFLLDFFLIKCFLIDTYSSAYFSRETLKSHLLGHSPTKTIKFTTKSTGVWHEKQRFGGDNRY
jgi:hypothetical protein